MRTILIFALLAISLTLASSVLVYTSNEGKYKMAGLQVRSAVLIGGAYDITQTADYTKWPSFRKFNLSIYPNPTFVVEGTTMTTTSVTNYNVTSNTNTLRTYKKMETNAGFAVVAETGKADFMPFLTASSELKAQQRQNFYSCAWYEKGTMSSSANPLVYTSHGCKKFSFTGEYNENKTGMNTTVQYNGFVIHWYLNYHHVNDNEMLPLYLSSVKVNKIRVFYNPDESSSTVQNPAWATHVSGSSGTFEQSFVGVNSGYWPGGFYLATSGTAQQPGTPTTEIMRSNDNRLVMTLWQKKSWTGTGFSGSSYYSSASSATFSSLTERCGHTIQDVSGAWEVEYQVMCTYGNILRVVSAMILSVAGFFALF